MVVLKLNKGSKLVTSATSKRKGVLQIQNGGGVEGGDKKRKRMAGFGFECTRVGIM